MSRSQVGEARQGQPEADQQQCAKPKQAPLRLSHGDAKLKPIPTSKVSSYIRHQLTSVVASYSKHH